MQVHQRGEGKPEYSIVGSLHGDEPAGKKAIEKILEEELKFQKPIKFIIGNERALKKDVRFTDCDLNRSFPGDSSSENYEERLARKIMREIEGTMVVDLHTTHSFPRPFATFSNLNNDTRRLLKSSGVENAVYFPEHTGTLNEQVDGIVIEAGYQKTEEAVSNAVSVLKNFMAAEGIIEGDFSRSEPDIFEYTETVEGDWEFRGQNFRKVKSGEIYAERDGEELKAKEDFYPVLMSTDGYRDKLGFKAKKIEELKD